jgi:S-(hydroxymethyl)glutathione dehydrogenase / alcohol dehydrogenase
MGLMSRTSVSDGTFRVQAREQNVYPYSLLGTFSPYLVVHRTSVVKIDPAIPFEAAALVSCGVTTGWARRYGPPTSGRVRTSSSLALVASGCRLWGVVNSGARHVFVVEPAE